jgi:hypothetical protein
LSAENNSISQILSEHKNSLKTTQHQLLAHGRWFSPASSTTKTGRHDIAESGVKTPKTNQNH